MTPIILSNDSTGETHDNLTGK